MSLVPLTQRDDFCTLSVIIKKEQLPLERHLFCFVNGLIFGYSASVDLYVSL